MSPLRELRSWRRVRLTLVRERAQEPYGLPPVIRRGADVVALVRAFLRDDPREVFAAIYLDAKYRPVALHACSVGTASTCLVHPREVLAPALLLSASALVVAHNHPSGDPAPSPEDRAITDRLRSAGELVGVELLDHVVVGIEAFYSFADGLLHLLPGGRQP